MLHLFFQFIDNVSEQEQVILDGMIGEDNVSSILDKKGFGLYDPDVTIHGSEVAYDPSILASYFDMKKPELDKIFLEIVSFIDEHAKDEYKARDGQMHLLGNGLYLVDYSTEKKYWESYPFPELWKELYEKIIKDEKTFWNVYFANRAYIKLTRSEKCPDDYYEYAKHIFGELHQYELPDKKYSGDVLSNDMIYRILCCIKSMFDLKTPREVNIQCVKACIHAPENIRWHQYEGPKVYGMTEAPILYHSFTEYFGLGELFNALKDYASKEEFEEAFFTFREIDELYDFNSHESQKYCNRTYYHENTLTLFQYIKAYEYGLISADEVYQVAFEHMNLEDVVSDLSIFMKEKPNRRDLMMIEKYLDGAKYEEEHPFIKLGKMFYERIVNVILDVELKRGDSETIFSKAIMNINVVYGMERLVAILKALGKDTLDRSTYYYYTSSRMERKACLSHLLQVCYPVEGDDAEKLGKLIKGSSIKETRLIETALYAPQWLDIIEAYLAYPGFKSSCYYFMAHMNERFDDRKKAMIAKYTPLSEEELNDGCFDVDWFFEAYNQLGEAIFAKIYTAAKYISDGNKHSRARKYADSALGLVTRDDLERLISDKRNKDLLMSYGLLPIQDEKDQLHRYEFIQKFLKESKQFGAQRRASEAKAVEVSLKNLATRAGFIDDLRLILAMETAIVTENASMFDEVSIGDYLVSIQVDKVGKPALVYKKDGKTLKSTPAAIKKDETFLARKEFVTKLRGQYARCVAMFENAMEQREHYRQEELINLCKNPVIKAILDKIVFVAERLQDVDGKCSEKTMCMINDDGFIDSNGAQISLNPEHILRVAHPYDLYENKCWQEYQRLFFEKQQSDGIKQPFKQVFRELYLKLPEEIDAFDSRMFAGNQIQPAKTVGALKNRRWVADYEDGLQKVYYKDNIIATIYAMADWFSPSDVEPPTLEYVAFYDRKTFEPMKLIDVPPIIYSEIMRDTDLAVSVAHAGGVDPLTTHSTIEMRKVIISFNLELFKLTNVKLEGSHAFITGTYGEYGIHLGSGVIHQIGGHQINVLPVHSQSRGKMFLPFIDDDPKTAEIMSKIILFAEDKKIKDPYIMEQILRN